MQAANMQFLYRLIVSSRSDNPSSSLFSIVSSNSEIEDSTFVKSFLMKDYPSEVDNFA